MIQHFLFGSLLSIRMASPMRAPQCPQPPPEAPMAVMPPRPGTRQPPPFARPIQPFSGPSATARPVAMVRPQPMAQPEGTHVPTLSQPPGAVAGAGGAAQNSRGVNESAALQTVPVTQASTISHTDHGSGAPS